MANPIVFRRNSNIGAADAESDATYLDSCFVDTGDLQTLLDCSDPKSLVLGRTGSGKTALLKQVLKTAENAVELSPEALALHYVNNSQVLQFFEAIGVNLDLFYTLLWRHIITVELLKMRYGITNEGKQNDFLDKIKQFLQKNTAKQRALKYLSDWGSKFWEETEYRTKEFTRRLETDLSASVSVDAKYVTLGAEGAKKLSEEQKVEVRNSAMRVVNEVQIKELHDVIALLSDDIFNDPQKRFYLVIDRLDENWVDDRIRFKLLKALVEAIRTFRKVEPVKIIAALRTDLHYRMLMETAGSGFQEEKHRSLYLPIKWTRVQLVKMLDDRVAFMFRRQYTKGAVSLSDILPPNQIEQRSALEYILDRTFFRPREAIIYLNECIAKSEGSSKITVAVLRQAEVTYSQQRLISLADEWRREFANLSSLAHLLDKREPSFVLADVSKEDCTAIAVTLLEKKDAQRDPITELCEKYYLEETLDFDGFREQLFHILYRVGLIGVKPDPQAGRQWSYLDQPALTQGQITPKSEVAVHKTFWSALGINRRR